MAYKNSVSRRSSADRGSQVIRPVSLSAQLTKMFRHPGLIALALVAGAVLAAAVSILSPAKYEATATVLAQPLSADPNAASSSQLQVDIDNEAAIAGSRQVAEAAAANLNPADTDLVSTLRNNIEVAAHSGTAIMDVTATANTAEDAAAYANAVAQAYLDVRQQNLQQIVEANSENIQQKIQALGSNDSVARTALQEQLAVSEATSTNPGRVISSAQVPTSSSNLGIVQYLIVGLVAGLLLGLVLAWIADSRQRRVGYLDRAEDTLETNVFAIRKGQETEDARRALRLLGVTDGNFKNAGMTGTIIYSPSLDAAEEFASFLKQASLGSHLSFSNSLTGTPWAVENKKASANVIVADASHEYSEVLNAADNLGSAIIVIKPNTAVRDIEEFATVAQTATAAIQYVYLQK